MRWQVVAQSSGRRVSGTESGHLGAWGGYGRTSRCSCVCRWDRISCCRNRVDAGVGKQLEGNIHGMAFDTAAANIGMDQEVCIRIEHALEKSLVWFACCHHTLIVVLKDVFETCMGPSSGPNISLINRHHSRWPFIVQRRPQHLTTTVLSSTK